MYHSFHKFSTTIKYILTILYGYRSIVKVKVAQSCLTLCNPMGCPWNSPGQNSGVGSLSLLQGIFPTQGSKPGLPHCGWILYQLNHKGSPRILEVGSLSLLQRICPTQESNRDLLHCRRILYQLSYQGSPFTGDILKQRNGGRDKV